MGQNRVQQGETEPSGRPSNKTPPTSVAAVKLRRDDPSPARTLLYETRALMRDLTDRAAEKRRIRELRVGEMSLPDILEERGQYQGNLKFDLDRLLTLFRQARVFPASWSTSPSWEAGRRSRPLNSPSGSAAAWSWIPNMWMSLCSAGKR